MLWRRRGETPRSRVLDEAGAPGRVDCVEPADREALASVFALEPALADSWRGPEPVETAAAGQEDAFLAPATATADPRPAASREPTSSRSSTTRRRRSRSLVDGEPVAELPPSLDGMYIDGAGRGAFWPAGELEAADRGPVEVEVRAEAPSGLQEALGVERRVWLGELAASSAADPVAPHPDRRLRRLRRPLPLRPPGAWPVKEGFRRPADSPSPVLGGVEVERPPEPVPLRLHRRHRAQRHPRARPARLAPRPVRPRPGRGPLPHRSRRLSRPARRRGNAGAVRRAPARVLVARLSDQPDARHVPVRRPRPLRRRGRALRGRPRRRPRGGLPSAVLRPARLSRRRGPAAWSSRAPTTSPRRRPCTASSPRRASSTSSATGATRRPRGSPRPGA